MKLESGQLSPQLGRKVDSIQGVAAPFWRGDRRSNICYGLMGNEPHEEFTLTRCPALSYSFPWPELNCTNEQPFICRFLQSIFLKLIIGKWQVCESSTSGCSTESERRFHRPRYSVKAATVTTLSISEIHLISVRASNTVLVFALL